MKWKHLPIKNKAEMKDHIKLMMKTLQVSKHEVYLIGGTNSKVQDSYNYALSFNTDTHLLEILPHMNDERMNFGTVLFDGYIYCVGGAGSQ